MARKRSGMPRFAKSFRTRCVKVATTKYAIIQSAASAPTAGRAKPAKRPIAPIAATKPARTHYQRGKCSASRILATLGGVEVNRL